MGSCCGRKSQADLRKSLEYGPLVYSTDAKPRSGKCPLCKKKGKSQSVNSQGELVRVWLCQGGHVLMAP